jgi:hypothetical protein
MNNDNAWVWIVAGVAILILVFSHGPEVGYQGRDGKYDVYCGYKPGPFPGDSDYECVREPAKKF